MRSQISVDSGTFDTDENSKIQRGPRGVRHRAIKTNQINKTLVHTTHNFITHALSNFPIALELTHKSQNLILPKNGSVFDFLVIFTTA